MSDSPWLSIIGQGEDGPEGLSAASRKALSDAKIIMGPPRHLILLGATDAQLIEWPVPFADGIEKLLALRGQSVAILASGDPFWFGAGTSVTRHLEAHEWQAFPSPSTFSLTASKLGWAVQDTLCLGLHAAPLQKLRPHLAEGFQSIVLLRDGQAVEELATYLSEHDFSDSRIHVLEALGGPNERITQLVAKNPVPKDIAHPVCVGIEVRGKGRALPLTSGKPDDWFENDGQITKRPVRALTLSALAPKAGEHLLDIGGGSGSISIEWLLAHPKNKATIIEANPERAARIKANAARFGLGNLTVIEGKTPDALADILLPDAIFIGGGLSAGLLQSLVDRMPSGTRLVANSVTLESESLLVQWQSHRGGDLLRIELSSVTSIGTKRGWKAAYPLVQWSVIL
jgi:precorrin-6Y C5,15-methyltransferase (decarboxylating)